jgi:hypothetical protein
MNNRALMVLILVVVLVVGGYVVYQNQHDDITVELPNIDIH